MYHAWCVFFIHNQFCGLLSAYQPTACQPHSLRRERWGLTRYGLKPGCGMRLKREMKRGWVLIGGWCGSECDGVFHQQLSIPAHPLVPRPLVAVTCVYHSRCVLASLISLMVLACLAKCGHCVRRSESGMALEMMSLQSSHLMQA